MFSIKIRFNYRRQIFLFVACSSYKTCNQQGVYKTLRLIFPLFVWGSCSTNRMCRGFSYFSNVRWQICCNRFKYSADSFPSTRSINCSPNDSCGRDEIKNGSVINGSSFFSSCSGENFIPPEMMTWSFLPRIRKVL